MSTADPDSDLETLDRLTLLAEARKLRQAIREHRDSIGHELCWHHPKMWDLLPDKRSIEVTVPEWPQFMRGCVRYRSSLDQQLPEAPRTREESTR